jgi:hypothetical protein
MPRADDIGLVDVEFGRKVRGESVMLGQLNRHPPGGIGAQPFLPIELGQFFKFLIRHGG